MGPSDRRHVSALRQITPARALRFNLTTPLLHVGEHQAIVPQDLWDRVQAKLTDKTACRDGQRDRAYSGALLLGHIRDGVGRPMTSTYTQKGTRRYRYYVSSVSSETNAGVKQAEAAALTRIAMA